MKSAGNGVKEHNVHTIVGIVLGVAIFCAWSDWRQFMPGQVQPPPPRQQVCRVVNGGYLICQ